MPQGVAVCYLSVLAEVQWAGHAVTAPSRLPNSAGSWGATGARLAELAGATAGLTTEDGRPHQERRHQIRAVLLNAIRKIHLHAFARLYTITTTTARHLHLMPPPHKPSLLACF